MQLTLYSDYSFRVLFYLSNMKNETATIAEISDFFGISKNHLVKIVHQLAQQGFITSLRGKGGGIKLAKQPDEIGLSEILQKTEPNFHLVECFNTETNQCIITGACKLKGILNEAMLAFFQVLDNYTMADAINSKITKQISQTASKQKT